MASLERYRPLARESYQPSVMAPNANASGTGGSADMKSPTKRLNVPPAVPSPPPSQSQSQSQSQSRSQAQSQSHTSRPHSQSHSQPPTQTQTQTQSQGAQSQSRQQSASVNHSTSSQSHQTMAMREPSPIRSSTLAAEPSSTSSPAQRNQWIFTRDEVDSSPSIIDGLSYQEERTRRAKGVNFIIQAAILLELPQTTIFVAALFFHRFYMRVSMVTEKEGTHHYNTAAAALFLANKNEENCRKTKDVVIAVARVAQKNAKLVIDEQSKEFWRWRDSILAHEMEMLRTLTFDLKVDNPHNLLYRTLEQINQIHNRTLRQAAWAFCNDCAMTPMPLMFDSREMAIAAIFFSSIYSKQRIPDIGGTAWYLVLGGEEERMIAAINVMELFYQENPLQKPENPIKGLFPFHPENSRCRTESVEASPAEGPGNERGEEVSRDRDVPATAKDATGNTESVREDQQRKSDTSNSSSRHSNGTKRPNTDPPSSPSSSKRQRIDDNDEGEVSG